MSETTLSEQLPGWPLPVVTPVRDQADWLQEMVALFELVNWLLAREQALALPHACDDLLPRR